MVRETKRQGISEEERSHNLNVELSQLRMGNAEVWESIATKLARQKNPLTGIHVQKILGLSEERHTSDMSVADLLYESSVADVRKDYFLSRIVFNYDSQRGGAERRRNAVHELMEGKRTSVIFSSDEFLTIEDWFEREIRSVSLRKRPHFDRASNTATDRYEPEYMHDHHVLTSDIWTGDGLRRMRFGKALKFMEKDDLLKSSGKPYFTDPAPTVIKRVL